MKKGTNNTQRCRRRVRAAASPESKTSLESSGVGLQLDKLEELLCETILPYCHNSETRRHYRHQFQGLADQNSLSRAMIHDIIIVLLEVLNSPTMPCTLVAYIHSTIGLLYISQGETRLAIHSLTKALWIETSLLSANRANLGLTLHRLAVCRARLGDHHEAQTLLTKVLKLYKSCSLKNDMQVGHAQEELDRLEAATVQQRNVRRKSNEGLSLKLDVVLEEEGCE